MVKEAPIQSPATATYREISPIGVYVFGIFNDQKEPYIQCATKIEDSKKFASGYFLLDTGASVTVIQKKLAKSIGFEFSRELEIYEITGFGPKGMDCNKFNATFWFRGMKISDTEVESDVLVATDSEIYVPCGEIISSVIGRNMLKKFSQTYDFPSGTIDLKTADSQAEAFKAYKINPNKI